jgi:hypothetical protein
VLSKARNDLTAKTPIRQAQGKQRAQRNSVLCAAGAQKNLLRVPSAFSAALAVGQELKLLPYGVDQNRLYLALGRVQAFPFCLFTFAF